MVWDIFRFNLTNKTFQMVLVIDMVIHGHGHGHDLRYGHGHDLGYGLGHDQVLVMVIFIFAAIIIAIAMDISTSQQSSTQQLSKH